MMYNLQALASVIIQDTTRKKSGQFNCYLPRGNVQSQEGFFSCSPNNGVCIICLP